MDVSAEYVEKFEKFLEDSGIKFHKRSWPNGEDEYGRFLSDGSFFIVRGLKRHDSIDLRVYSADRTSLEDFEKFWTRHLLATANTSMEQVLKELSEDTTDDLRESN